jgi:hypothetical protein
LFATIGTAHDPATISSGADPIDSCAPVDDNKEGYYEIVIVMFESVNTDFHNNFVAPHTTAFSFHSAQSVHFHDFYAYKLPDV